MGVSYRIEYLATVVREDIPALSAPTRERIRTAIERKLATNPVEFGKPLRYSLRGARRLRVGDYRVIYVIEPPDTVVIVKIGHRREVYREWH
ncbi:MAG: type II toxin-antitoxin system RelE/ParE family toxin [Deltaproteobacteria bacterium]|nr:MAG: type II toxin-antitoxin system RelE/ParE family toxin [Deltaproteobacteria bacterium]